MITVMPNIVDAQKETIISLSIVIYIATPSTMLYNLGAFRDGPNGPKEKYLVPHNSFIDHLPRNLATLGPFPSQTPPTTPLTGPLYGSGAQRIDSNAGSKQTTQLRDHEELKPCIYLLMEPMTEADELLDVVAAQT